MSDEFLVVIPADADAALPETAPALRDALAALAGGGEARVKDYGKVQFIDCGANFERVLCPVCGAELGHDRWAGQMVHCWDAERGFHLHPHALPCCGVPLALDRLVYEGRQGFARWMVSARNGGRGPLSEAELSELGRIAGMALTGIAQRY